MSYNPCSGISSFYYKNSRWIDEGRIPGIYGSVHKVLESNSGILWLGTNVNWIWKVSLQNDLNNNISTKANGVADPFARNTNSSQKIDIIIVDLLFVAIQKPIIEKTANTQLINLKYHVL